MIQIEDFAGHAVATLLVVVSESIGFLPKASLVDLVAPENGLLHIARDERLVEIPDKSDSVLGEQSLRHSRQERGSNGYCNGNLRPAKKFDLQFLKRGDIAPCILMAIALPDISQFKKRIEEIDELMNQPDFFNDARRSASLSREQLKLRQLIEDYDGLSSAKAALAEHKELLQDAEGDDELKELAREELPELEAEIERLEQKILVSMIPPEDSDSRNTIVEIRAGAGGDEASLFAGELFRMYGRLAERRGWSLEQLGSSESGINGFKEVAFLIRGDEVYKQMKFESGVHRVQRVPATESQGRIHTSTVTVAVLPEAEEVDVQIDPQDLEITVTRASGPGGQGVNTTDSAVQILHKPTGIIVNCADERSQIKNKAKAMTVLRSRLLQAKKEEERAKYAENRKKQVGTGDRSERIRTYNFPQSRLTDHRIGLTIHSLPQVMEGELDEVIEALQAEDQKLKIEALMTVQAES